MWNEIFNPVGITLLLEWHELFFLGYRFRKCSFRNISIAKPTTTLNYNHKPEEIFHISPKLHPGASQNAFLLTLSSSTIPKCLQYSPKNAIFPSLSSKPTTPPKCTHAHTTIIHVSTTEKGCKIPFQSSSTVISKKIPPSRPPISVLNLPHTNPDANSRIAGSITIHHHWRRQLSSGNPGRLLTGRFFLKRNLPDINRQSTRPSARWRPNDEVHY